MKKVLDPACGSRKWWFRRDDPRVVMMDVRSGSATVKDQSHGRIGGVRVLNIEPDLIGDWRAIPFPDETFNLVAWDPPHLLWNRTSPKGWLSNAYGTLGPNWKDDLAKGFREIRRVLRLGGTLVFKWSETNIKTTDIIQLAGSWKPLFGTRRPRAGTTHWIVWTKEDGLS